MAFAAPTQPSEDDMTDTVIDPNALYRVRVTHPVEIIGTKLWPGQEIELRGDLVEEHRDAVELVERHG